MARVEPNDLSVFLTIARHRSIRKAADEMGVTPSALSHALRGLEEDLGVRLFNRTTRSVAPTEAGERLQARIAPAFRDIDDALEDLNSFRDMPTGTLRINASRASAEIILLPIVTRFLVAYPGVNVDIVANNAFVDMVSQGFDAGVRFGEVIAQDMIAVPLGPPQRTAYVASPDFFRRYPRPTTPDELKGLPCIRFRFESGRYYAWEFERDNVELSVEVNGRLTLGEQDLAVQAALDGAGIAFAFEAQVKDFIEQGRLERVLEDWCPHYPGFYLYYPSRRQLPAALRAFVDFARRSILHGT
ncbi:LysR family transcriptional regulator [Mesorhizobium loti]|uniref:LysR family transcriptional regulator n=1 Tax=Rhizobium loti TaxID=381 RepID=UPI0004068B56|nr:LysR family transcriptional regulator [Mesorhizobium loti]